jgi:hypothetical protein
MCKCCYPGCSRQAKYGPLNCSAITCKEHKEVDFISTFTKRCSYEFISDSIYIKCMKSASFNHPRETIPKFCNAHKELNMVNVKFRRCKHINADSTQCSSRARYNHFDYKIPLYCEQHKFHDMVLFDLNHVLMRRIMHSDNVI